MHYSSFGTARLLDLIATVGLGPLGAGPRGKVGPRGSRGRALALLLACLPLHAADYWIAPPGTGSGTISNCTQINPMPYVTADLQTIILNNPKAPTTAEVNLYFTNGTYHIDRLVASYPQSRKLKLAPYPGVTIGVTFRWQVPTTNQGYGPSLFNAPGSWDPFLLSFVDVMERFEATNLVIDVNWPAWAATSTVASPAFPDGFKMSALWVQANEGLLQGLKVKNCGASGRVPAPNWNGAGAEAFPIYVQPRDYLRNHPDPAWIIEDCEVSDFHAVHGGYATMIMVQPSDPQRYTKAATDILHRVAAVRHCFISGNGAGIGFGSAGSVGVTFYENLLSDLHDGFNFNTASEAEPLRYFDITNNVFLDVHSLGNIGAAGTCGFFSDFTVSQNAVRLRGVPLEQDHTDFRWTNQVFGSWSNRMPVTDVSLAVGRFATGACHGLRLAGASNIVFAGNRFTTWPQTNFFLPDRTNLDQAAFVPLWLPSSVSNSLAWVCPSTGVTFTNTWLSARAFEFTNLYVVANSVVTNGADALTINPAEFEPWGRPGRLRRAAGEPAGALEVALGKPVLTTNGVVTVRALYLNQFFATNMAYPNRGTSRLPIGDLRLMVRTNGVEQVLDDPCPEEIASGVAEFQFTPTAHTHYELIVYQDEEPAGFDPEREPWARTEYDHGTVVRFERTPDVANDRRLIAGQLNLVRTGTNSSLVVKLRSAPTNQVGRPGLAGDDFDLHYSSGSPVPTNNGVWSCTMNGGSQVLRVVPRSGTNNQDVAEYEAAYFEIVEDPTNYGIGTSGWGVSGLSYLEGTQTHPVAAVTLWDGPKYRHYALTDYYDCQSGMAALGQLLPALETEAAWEDSGGSPLEPAAAEALAQEDEVPLLRFTRLPLDEAVWGLPGAQDAWTIPLGREGPRAEATPGEAGLLEGGQLSPLLSAVYDVSGASPARMPGAVAYSNDGQCPGAPIPYFTMGGRWVTPNYGDLLTLGTPWSSPQVFGVDNAGNLVGRNGSQAYWYGVSNGTQVPLTSLTAGAAGQAVSIVPQGGVVVGWSGRTNNGTYYRPTRWSVANPTSPEDLGSFDGNPITVGHAFMINSNLVTVGRTWVTTTNNVGAWRAFRTITNVGGNTLTSEALQGLKLPDPPATNQVNANWANGLNRSDDAVGATEHWRVFLSGTNEYRLETRMAVWWETNAIPSGMDVCLEPVPAAAYDRSGRTEAINEAGVIVGNGTLNTQPWGWVLVPQPVATQ